MTIIKCIWLDSAVTKACKVLRARLAPIGIEVVCKCRLPDEIINELSKMRGCVVVSTDRHACSKFGWICIDFDWIERKSARDIATRIIKLVFGPR